MKMLTQSLMLTLALIALAGMISVSTASAEMIAYYDFEEGSGTTLTDLSGNGMDGTWSNASGLSNYSTDVPAALSSSTQAGSFNRVSRSSGDYATLPHLGLALNASEGSGVTVSFWLKKEGDSQNWVVSESCTVDSNPSLFYNLGVDCGVSDDKATLMVFDNTHSSRLNAKTTQTVGDDTNPQWHHVAWTDNGVQPKFYVDGVLDSTDFTYPDGVSLTTCDITMLGGWQRMDKGYVDYLYDGLIDDFAAWDTILNDTQIASLAAGTSPLTVPEPSMAILILGAIGTFLMIRRKCR